MEGSGRGLIWETTWNLHRETEAYGAKSQDSRCPDRDSNGQLSNTALPLKFKFSATWCNSTHTWGAQKLNPITHRGGASDARTAVEVDMCISQYSVIIFPPSLQSLQINTKNENPTTREVRLVIRVLNKGSVFFFDSIFHCCTIKTQ